MISAEQNELMTRIGPGTPAGRLLRRYWQPVALVDEFDASRPVKAVRVLGEDWVLFKDHNTYGLIERHCAHRGLFVSNGDVYAMTVVRRLGHAEAGLVRLGCAAYTSDDEVERAIAAVAEVAKRAA